MPEWRAMPPTEDLTHWLEAVGTDQAIERNDRLFAALYDELRGIAHRHMRGESSDHTLSATALAHEAYFRLNEQSATGWRNRAHFLAVASTMMRRILVNHALAHRAAKRDAALVSLTLTEVEQLGAQLPRDIVALHDALLAFETIDARAARVVELRFFGGLEYDEIAEVLAVSVPTVKRDWTLARAWLERALAGG